MVPRPGRRVPAAGTRRCWPGPRACATPDLTARPLSAAARTTDGARLEITAEHLRKAFGATVAVHDVSFEIARGEVVGFLGPNGAGKSTTLRMLTGVFPPSSGRAIIAGRDVAREPLAARRAMGYLPERAASYGDMQVERYLRFIAEMKGIGARELTAAVREAMGATGIEHVSHRLIGNLSKGYRQRVGIAQALIGSPPVLILDEPTSGLDPEQVTEIRGLVQGLGSERTVILSTHILPEVESICSRVIIMNRGRILAVDSPASLEEHLRPSEPSPGTTPRLSACRCGARRALGSATSRSAGAPLPPSGTATGRRYPSDRFRIRRGTLQTKMVPTLRKEITR